MFMRYVYYFMIIGLVIFNWSNVLALPSDVNVKRDSAGNIISAPGHGDITKMAAELKYDRNDNGFRDGVKKAFGETKTKEKFAQSMANSSIAEDQPEVV
jgi:hypothetical protein